MEAQVKQLQEELEGLGLSSLPGLRSLGDINDIPLPKLHSLQSQLRLDLEAVDGVSPAGQLLSLQGRAKRTGSLPGLWLVPFACVLLTTAKVQVLHVPCLQHTVSWVLATLSHGIPLSTHCGYPAASHVCG